MFYVKWLAAVSGGLFFQGWITTVTSRLLRLYFLVK
jgi:hypothetical protein